MYIYIYINVPISHEFRMMIDSTTREVVEDSGSWRIFTTEVETLRTISAQRFRGVIPVPGTHGEKRENPESFQAVGRRTCHFVIKLDVIR